MLALDKLVLQCVWEIQGEVLSMQLEMWVCAQEAQKWELKL